MTRPRSLALLLALLSGAIGCAPGLAVESEVTGVCAWSVPLDFEGSSGSWTRARATVADIGLDVDSETVAVLEDPVLRAGTGIDDFRFADSLSLDLSSASGELPTVRIVEMEEVSGASPMTAPADRTVNLAGYLREESLILDVELSGSPPEGAWSAEVDLCLGVEGAAVEDVTVR